MPLNLLFTACFLLSLWACRAEKPETSSKAERAARRDKFIESHALDELNFQNKILNSNRLALIDFWSSTAPRSKQVAIILEELESEFEGKIIAGTVDINKAPELAARYSVRNVPTILLLKNGVVLERVSGTMTKPTLRNKIAAHL